MIEHPLTKYCGLLTVVLLWTSVGYSMVKTHLKLIDLRPLSYLGIDSRSAVIFSAGLVLAAITMVVFAGYLTRTYRLSGRFLGVVIVGQLGQVVTALSPYGHGATRLAHTVAAFTLAFSIPLLMLLFMNDQTGIVKKTARNFMYVEILAFGVGIGLFIFTKGVAPLAEIITALVFHCWLLWLSFRSASLASVKVIN